MDLAALRTKSVTKDDAITLSGTIETNRRLPKLSQVADPGEK